MGGPKLSGVIVCPKFKSAERRYTVDCASCLHLINLDRDTVATPPANSRMYGLHPQRPVDMFAQPHDVACCSG